MTEFSALYKNLQGTAASACIEPAPHLSRGKPGQPEVTVETAPDHLGSGGPSIAASPGAKPADQRRPSDRVQQRRANG
jgi:hypothetical protein